MRITDTTGNTEKHNGQIYFDLKALSEKITL